MAKHGTVKHLANSHEDHIAKVYKGTKSPSSGAAVSDAGDVRILDWLIECKMTGTPGEKPKQIPKIVQDFEKIADEAHAEGRNPMLCLRYYHPNSRLSDKNGWVDLTIRLTEDDAEMFI